MTEKATLHSTKPAFRLLVAVSQLWYGLLRRPESAKGMVMAKVAVKQPSLRKLPSEFLMCRDFGHAWTWDRTHGAVISEGPGLVSRTLTCLRCYSARTDYIRRTGETESRRYKHADGYLMPKHGYTKADIRAASIRAAAAGMRPKARRNNNGSS